MLEVLMWSTGIVGSALLLTLLFDKSVRTARFLSAAQTQLYHQYLYPDSQTGDSVVQEFYLYKEGVVRDRSAIAERVQAIRELTGRGRKNHVRAIEELGRLLMDVATPRILGDFKTSERPVEASEWLVELIKRVDPSANANRWTRVSRAEKINDWLCRSSVDLDHVVELLIAATLAISVRRAGESELDVRGVS